MRQFFQKIITQFPFLKPLQNKYILILIFFIIWMLFLDNYSYLEHRILNKQINSLEDSKNFFLTEIQNDSIQIQQLKQTDEIEKLAREKYFMKRDSEDIYIIDLKK